MHVVFTVGSTHGCSCCCPTDSGKPIGVEALKLLLNQPVENIRGRWIDCDRIIRGAAGAGDGGPIAGGQAGGIALEQPAQVVARPGQGQR